MKIVLWLLLLVSLCVESFIFIPRIHYLQMQDGQRNPVCMRSIHTEDYLACKYHNVQEIEYLNNSFNLTIILTLIIFGILIILKKYWIKS